ncbi:MAG: AI-2E family transporter [Planctomycetota bacterium]|jgi:predicted PurR-regulated permease PerM
MARKKSSKSKAKKSAKSSKKSGGGASVKKTPKKTPPQEPKKTEPAPDNPPKLARQTKTLPRAVKALDVDYSQVLGMRNVRWLIVILAVVGAIIFGWWLSEIFIPLLAAVGIAYILNPAVERIQRRGVSRPRAVIWIFLCLLVGMIAFGSWFAASVVKDVRNMSTQLGDLFTDAEENSDEWIARYNNNVPEFVRIEGDDLNAGVVIDVAREKFIPHESDVESAGETQARASLASARAELLKSFQVLDANHNLKLDSDEIDKAELTEMDANTDGMVSTSEWFARFGVVESAKNDRTIAPEAKSSIDTIFGFLKSGVAGIFTLLLFLTLVPIYTWYFMVGFDDATARLKTFLPGRHRDRIVRILGEIDDMMKAFFRGRIVVVLIVSIMSTIVFLIFDVQYAFLLGAMSGLGILIPLFAFVAGLAPAIILMLIAGDSSGAIIGMSLAFMAIQGFEQYVLTPKLLGDAVELHPVTLLVGVFVMGSLFGVFGALLAVPLTAIAKTLGREFLLPYFKHLAEEKPAA